VTRHVIFVALGMLLGAACQPKQPLQPSFFTAKDPNAPASCKATLDCYAACAPLTEECMLLCDQKSEAHRVESARAVSYCSAQHGCTDAACTDERCAAEVQACVAPVVAPAPAPMAPQPYPGQVGGPAPMQPQPYPGQPPMQPQPYGPPPPPPPYAGPMR
jgi:hypothetical protein